MRMKHAKRMLAVIMVSTMVMASALTVCAAGGSGSSDGTGGSSNSSETSSGSGSHKSSSKSSGAVSSSDLVSADSSVTVAGMTIKTTIGGAYGAKGVRGTAVITDVDTVRTNLGLKSTQSPFIIVLDTDVKMSYKAMESINAAVAALGVQYVTALNIDLGAKELGKFVTLENGSVNMIVGLPASADMTKEYSVVLVQPGGTTTILTDQDTNPETVTFEVKAGLGTYAIVAK